MYIESQPNWESQHFGRTRNRSSDPIVDQVESAVQRSDYTTQPPSDCFVHAKFQGPYESPELLSSSRQVDLMVIR
ncbi:unnamed protein product, partial [Mesorhabditis spiculigera]